jgi:hypothetical protein
MSGAPVFDGGGALVGLLSTSLEREDDDPSPSFVALLWPALMARFRRAWPAIAHVPSEVTLIELASIRGSGESMCSIDRPDALSQTQNGEVIYQVWE